MADPLGYFFSGTDPGTNNANFILRQKIAMSLLAGKKGYPNTLGQGLTALGDAIGNLRLRRQMEQDDVAAQREAMGTPAAPGAPQPQAAYTPGDATRSAYAVERDAEAPARAETPLYTAPSQPSSMLASATPSGLTAPQPTLRDLRTDQTAEGDGAGATPSRSSPASEEDGGYNVIDAQAGTRMAQSPEYARAAIARATRNPDMQAYLGNLVAKESPRPNDVSSTGAKGPFQFVPGTARQYGLTDPNNPDASAQAALQLTGDNAAQFTRRFGRPPTMQELAVMHQQGAGGGGNLLAGQGTNPRNLAVNNIAANASPQAAVSRINNFYGMPDRTVDPRAGVAQAMLAQNASQRPPVMNADDQQAALPPVQRQMAPQAAPLQVAQAPQGQPAPIPGYVTPQPGQAPGPRQIQPSEEEVGLQNYVNALTMRNPYAAQSPQAIRLQRLQTDRAAAQEVENKRFTSALKTQEDLTRIGAEQRGTQVERQNANLKDQEAIKKARIDNKIQADFGGLPPAQVFEQMQASRKEADLAKQGLQAADNARKAILGGAILGAGADTRLSIAKVVTGMGLKDMGNDAANTEVFRAAMAPVVASLLRSTVGGTQISDNDRRFAERAAGGQITLEPTTIKRLIDITGRMAREKLDIHNATVDTFFPNNPQGKTMFGVGEPAVKKEDPLLSKEEKKQIDDAENWLLRNPRDPMAPAVRRKLGYQ
jgi:hypothetical protein